MESLEVGQLATDEAMEEFQLTELESRLEMTAALTTGETAESIIGCCECYWPDENPACYGL
jgi:hypothetical protein